jgi:hypothetical protein
MFPFGTDCQIRAKLLDLCGTYAVRKSMASTTIRFHPRRQPGNSLELPRLAIGLWRPITDANNF